MAAPPKTETSDYTTAPPIDDHAAPVAASEAVASPQGETVGAKSGRATAAMILGIVGVPLAVLIPIVGIILGILAIVFGAISRAEIARRGMANRGQATAGIVLGSIDVVLAIAIIAVAVSSRS